MAGLRYPKKLPTKTNGVEIPNHIAIKESKVVNGTAPEDSTDAKQKFKIKKITKTTPGSKKAVIRVHLFQFWYLSILHKVAEEYPAVVPMRTNKTTNAVIKLPRFAGERNPRTAKIIVTRVIEKT